MTTAAYSAALDAAYRWESPPDVIYAVKQAIINQLRELDPRVQARTTDFFSHSFAPDMILTWGRDGNVERPLFVRQDVEDAQLSDDLLIMQRERPIIFGLEPAFLRRERLQEAGATARETSTLITDASGIGQISERKSGSRVVSIAAPALLQGGRGVLDRQVADEVSTGLTRGFVAAGSLAVTETRDTVQLIEHTFQPAAADRMVEFLRAVWIGAGGSVSNFPGQTSSLHHGLTDEALQFLLDFEQNDSLEFWRRIGAGVTLDRLVSLELEPSRNFDSLLVANLDKITAKACGVSVGEQEEIAAEAPNEAIDGWHRLGDALAFRVEDVLIRLADTRDAVVSTNTPNDGLALPELLERAASVGLPFQSIELFTAARKIEYGVSDNATGQNVVNDAQLQEMAAGLGSTGLVRRGVASVPDAAALVVDFAEGVASGRTAAKYTVAALLQFAVPLLGPDRVALRRVVARMLSQNRSLYEPPSLFDF